MTRARRQAMLGAALFVLVIAVLTFPLRLALDWGGAAQAGLSARAVSGSIWSGRLAAAKWGALELGQLDMALSPTALLGGEAAVKFRRVDAAGTGAAPAPTPTPTPTLAPADTSLSGTLYAGGDKGWRDVNGRINLGMRLGGLSVEYVQMRGATAQFDALGRCVAAEGQIDAALSAPVDGLRLPQGMSGTLRCVHGQAQMALTSQSGMEVLEAELNGQGAWKARFLVKQASDPALVNGLVAMGFRAHGDAYMLSAVGMLSAAGGW
jgi:general secretion pathway protein N